MSAAPIFILAPLPRSGTNYLWDLLRMHPDCATGRSPIWEDYLLKNAGHLRRFAIDAQGSWDPVWGDTQPLRAELLRSLGDALIDFMATDSTRRLVTKSPTLENLELFFDLFPDANLVLLIRDGRDVVHSGMATFGWSLEDAARAWATAIDRVMQFVARDDVPPEQCAVVRYEDLFANTTDELRRLLPALRLDPQLFDFAALGSLPVRGSSTHRGDGRDSVHWDPVPRTEQFRPTERWRAWDGAALAAFTSTAGRQLALLGYET